LKRDFSNPSQERKTMEILRVFGPPVSIGDIKLLKLPKEFFSGIVSKFQMIHF
jgi:hypothetical protein